MIIIVAIIKTRFYSINESSVNVCGCGLLWPIARALEIFVASWCRKLEFVTTERCVVATNSSRCVGGSS